MLTIALAAWPGRPVIFIVAALVGLAVVALALFAGVSTLAADPMTGT